MSQKLVVKNVKQIATPSGTNYDVNILRNCDIIIEKGIITEITEGDQNRSFPGDFQQINGSGWVATPGFVDFHTHPIFYQTREREFEMRLQGKSYTEIAEAGGGIRSSVRAVRKASFAQIIEATLPRFDQFIQHGTTTIEGKTGYGLSTDSEIKMLEIIQRLKHLHSLEVIPTFLGAHEIPDEYRDNRKAYISLITEEMIPLIASRKLAVAADVFCEKGVYTPEETLIILKAAKKHGLEVKIHADQFNDTGGGRLAAELGALSADHLECINEDSISAMIEKETVFGLLPGAAFFLKMENDPPVRKIIGEGGIVALATDFNPGSSMTQSMPLMMTLAGLRFGMTPAESLVAATTNAARALKMQHKIGKLEAGFQADIAFWNINDYRYLPYHFGINHCVCTVKKGRVVFHRQLKKISLNE